MLHEEKKKAHSVHPVLEIKTLESYYI